ncbi:MAG: tetratricopeptide repeat protein [Gammaproteobacteria bacterium]|nr:tetratricopeptide repeat protein [Gammaproteobacteria bacterium]
MLDDRYGLPVTTTSATARDAYVDGVDRILAANPGVEAVLQRAIAADPGFALPHAALARQHQLCGRPAEARAAAEQAVALAAQATARERQHVEIFSRMVNGRIPAALELTREHLASHPRDAFVLAPSCGVFGLIGFSGRQEREPEQLALLEPLARHYGDDWWFLTAHAFALVEVGEWARGRTLVERSLEQFARNPHGAHIRAHALYEAGVDDEAIRYLSDWLPGYEPEGLLHCHLWWHYCLLKMSMGESDAAWQAYGTHCAPGVSSSPSINVLTDGAALLWRAELAGEPRNLERWQRLCDYYEQQFPRPIVFVDAHAGLAYAALGRNEALQHYVEQVQSLGEAGRLPAGTLGATLSRAFAAFAEGRWAQAIEILEPVMDRVVCIGGSRAQRDLVTNTLLAAYVKDGRADRARALLASIEDRRPTRAVAGLN